MLNHSSWLRGLSCHLRCRTRRHDDVCTSSRNAGRHTSFCITFQETEVWFCCLGATSLQWRRSTHSDVQRKVLKYYDTYRCQPALFMDMLLSVNARVKGTVFLLHHPTTPHSCITRSPSLRPKIPLRRWGGQFPVSFASGHARLRRCLCPSPCAKSKTGLSAQPWRWLLLWCSIDRDISQREQWKES